MDEETTEFHIKGVRKFRLYLAVFSSSLGALYVGLVLSYPSAALLTLNDPAKEIHALPNSEEETWIGSLMSLGSIPSALFSGPLADRFGRKRTLLVTSVLGGIGCVLIAAAQNMWMIYLGRVISGLAVGVYLMVVPIYVAEVSPPSLRGFMGTSFGIQASLGVAIMNAFGIGLDWRWCAVALLSCPIAMFVLVFFIPETPYWYAQRKRYEEAFVALSWLFETDEKSRDISIDPTERVGLGSWMQRDVLHPLIVCIFVMFFQQWTGLNVILTFQTQIEAGNLSPAVFGTISGIVQTIASVPSAMLVDRMGRRVLLMASGFIQGVGMAALAVYYKLAESESVESLGTWLPLTGVLVYFIGNSIGYAPIPWILNGEYFQTEHRGLSCGITAAINSVFGFVAIKLYDDIIRAVGKSGLFILFGTMSLGSCFFVLLFVAETRGKSLEEINRSFKNGKIFNLTTSC